VLFDEQPGFDPAQTLLVIDEAHNLPSRAAEARSHVVSLAQAQRGLSELEHADWQLRSWGVKHEYALWERGESVLLEPSVNFLAMTDIGLRLVDEHLPGHLSNHDRAEFLQPHPKVRAGWIRYFLEVSA
jgi:hypothetical protein